MLGYRRKSFRAAYGFLESLRADHTNLTALLSLQRLLIAEIVTAEQKIRVLKKELASRNKAGSETAPGKSSTYLENRIERLRQLNFVWRCFGDAVAFLYMDRFALKHTFYSTVNTNPKQTAGFIADKEGLIAESAVMEQALAAGIPSLLVDLTNTIRHGDICFMVGPDPRLVEVKAGKLGGRGRKQVQNIKQLHQFFETDHALGLRGFPEVRRVGIHGPERSYISEMNACIDTATERGCAIVNPERGLYYLAVTDTGPSTRELFEQIKAKRPWVFTLNEIKSSREWAPYFPFVLSIQSEARLYEFLRGTLYLVVVIDVDVLCAVAARKGFAAEFDLANEDYPLEITMNGLEGHARISAHILKRIALEFTSPEWIVSAALEGFERNLAMLRATAPTQ